VSVSSPELVPILKCSDIDVSAPFSASKGATVEIIDKSVRFRLKRAKKKNKIEDLEEINSESESTAIKHPSKKRHKNGYIPKNTMALLP